MFKNVKKHMRYLFQMLGVLLLGLCCQSEKECDLKGMWIGKYCIEYDHGNDTAYHYDGIRKILDFDEDTMAMKSFHWGCMFMGPRYKESKFYQYEDSLVILDKEVGTMRYKLSEDSLILFSEKDFLFEMVWEQIDTFSLASKKEKFNDLLLSFSFKLSDSVRIEFTENKEVVASNFYYSLGIGEHWRLDYYKSELFLVIGAFQGIALHIKEIRPDGFTGIAYGEKNEEMTFNALTTKPYFQLDYLLGEWRAYRKEDMLASKPPPINKTEGTLYDQEVLLISDTIIHQHILHKTDVLEWKSNREHDLLIFSNVDMPYWKILTLNKQELIIERPAMESDYDEIQTEVVRFIKQ